MPATLGALNRKGHELQPGADSEYHETVRLRRARMSTITSPLAEAPASQPPMATKGVLLSGISWFTYEALLADLKNRPIRLTYDRGDLEIMAPTFNHERCKRKM